MFYPSVESFGKIGYRSSTKDSEAIRVSGAAVFGFRNRRPISSRSKNGLKGVEDRIIIGLESRIRDRGFAQTGRALDRQMEKRFVSGGGSYQD